MRKLFTRLSGDEIAVVAAFARAEQNSEIERKSNSHKWDSITYAKALMRDGKRKGWLK